MVTHIDKRICSSQFLCDVHGFVEHYFKYLLQILRTMYGHGCRSKNGVWNKNNFVLAIFLCSCIFPEVLHDQWTVTRWFKSYTRIFSGNLYSKDFAFLIAILACRIEGIVLIQAINVTHPVWSWFIVRKRNFSVLENVTSGLKHLDVCEQLAIRDMNLSRIGKLPLKRNLHRSR